MVTQNRRTRSRTNPTNLHGTSGPRTAPHRAQIVALTIFTLTSITVPTPATAQSAFTCFGEPATHVGTNGDDLIFGTKGPDVIVARLGHDRIDAGGGDDLICAGHGNDIVNAGGGNDRVDSGRGHDTTHGGPGNDTITGNRGNDTLNGGGGNDTLRGGAGKKDTATGNGGDDTCVAETTHRSCEAGAALQATISKGAPVQLPGACEVSACRAIDVSLEIPSALTGQVFTVECIAEDSVFHAYNTSDPESSVCVYGFPGNEVWVTVDGVSSNTIIW